MSSQPVSLREITRENYPDFLNLSVAPAQRGLVADTASSIAQAGFHPEAWCRGVCAGDTAVGFAMLDLRPEEGTYYLWRLMIDQHHQGRGYGSAAVRLLVDHVRTLPDATELRLSHMNRRGHAGPFYEKLGFTYTGEEEHGERVMRLAL